MKIKHDGITCAMQSTQGTDSTYSGCASQLVADIMGETCLGV